MASSAASGEAGGSAMERAVAALRGASRIMVFTGAGMSAESGIGTFRNAGGLWSGITGKFGLFYFGTPLGWKLTPSWAWSMYIERFYTPIARARPNKGHEAIARLEKESGKDVAVITMNVDGLHQEAGSKRVEEVHGTVRRHRCIRNGHPMDVVIDVDRPGPAPACHCGSSARPDCVLFGEGLPPDTWDRSADIVTALKPGDVALVVGTSSMVYPAASLPEEAYKRNATIIEVNPEKSLWWADIVLEGTAAEVLPKLVDEALKGDSSEKKAR